MKCFKCGQRGETVYNGSSWCNEHLEKEIQKIREIEDNTDKQIKRFDRQFKRLI